MPVMKGAERGAEQALFGPGAGKQGHRGDEFLVVRRAEKWCPDRAGPQVVSAVTIAVHLDIPEGGEGRGLFFFS